MDEDYVTNPRRWLDTAAGVPETPEEFLERKKTTAYILLTATVGFLVLGAAAFQLSRGLQRTATWDELVVAGAVAIVTGIFLIVAVVVMWFDKPWLGHWND